METPPVEPDLVGPWKRNTWIYGLRTPFSFVFLGWLTLAQVISPRFDAQIYLFTILAAFLGLVVGAHYIDIGTSREKFSPHLRVPRGMLAVGLVSVALGIAVGVYMAFRWDIAFLAFVVVEGFAAVAYPRENPKMVHSYLGFGLAWGTIPFLGAYLIQTSTISLLALGLSLFIGLSVVMMHHLAIMSRESPAWKDALYLLRIYNYSVYIVAAAGLAGQAPGLLALPQPVDRPATVTDATSVGSPFLVPDRFDLHHRSPALDATVHRGALGHLSPVYHVVGLEDQVARVVYLH